ncbi:hypothetical protein HMPREF9141_0615 [Prevotella multiformis DSM 16608]|uniref:Uncharacterized protein n=1 Tax=Prevotella multiformis DSM 16608 TaxID=888743 RepID=F0F4U9_9BACT|nr:hypothetical protein HMPREF9141_0615 [Prevotella multiformis DSM 16608]
MPPSSDTTPQRTANIRKKKETGKSRLARLPDGALYQAGTAPCRPGRTNVRTCRCLGTGFPVPGTPVPNRLGIRFPTPGTPVPNRLGTALRHPPVQITGILQEIIPFVP